MKKCVFIFCFDKPRLLEYGRLFERGFIKLFRLSGGAYSRRAFIRCWALVQIITVWLISQTIQQLKTVISHDISYLKSRYILS